MQFWGDNLDEVFLQLILQLLKATDKGDIVLSDPSVRDGDRVGPGHEARVYNGCVPLCTPIEFTIPWENRCNNNPPTVTANIYYEGNEVATWSSPSVPPLSDNETEGTIILKGADDCNNNDMCNSTNLCHFFAFFITLTSLR